MFFLQSKSTIAVAVVFFITVIFLVVLYNVKQQQTFQVPAQTFDQASCEAEGGRVLPEGSACEGEKISIVINSSAQNSGTSNPEGLLVDQSIGGEPTQQPGQIKAMCCMRVEIIPTAEPTIIVPTEIARPTDSPVLATPIPTTAVLPSSSVVPTDIPNEPTNTQPSATPSTVPPTDSPQVTDGPGGGGGGGDSTNSCEIPAFTVTTEVSECALCSNL